MARENMALMLGWLLIVGFATAQQGQESEFLAPQPKEYIKTEGGRLDVFSEDFRQLQNADLGAAMITIEGNSMSLPLYSDSDALKYVLQGSAHAGVISPAGIPGNLRHIQKGDVLAVPKGWTIWIWNDKNEAVRLMAVARTFQGAMKGKWTAFHLMGGQEEYSGGVIHGFSKETLARAWNLKQEDVEQLLKAQTSTAFVKVDPEEAKKLTWQPTTPIFGDFVFHTRTADPEIFVKNGGVAVAVNARKLPILKEMDLSFCCSRLEQGAMMAPHYTTGAQVIHISGGKGRMEIVYPGGKNAFTRDVQGGDTIVVPAMFPIAMWAAGDSPLEWASFSNRHTEHPAFLSGFNSLFHALPREVLRQGLRLEEALFERVYATRRSRQEVAIFPPPEGEGKGWSELIKKFAQ